MGGRFLCIQYEQINISLTSVIEFLFQVAILFNICICSQLFGYQVHVREDGTEMGVGTSVSLPQGSPLCYDGSDRGGKSVCQVSNWYCVE